MRIRSRIALLIAVLFVLGTGTIAAYQSQPKSVTVTEDGKVTQYETTEALVEEFLTSEGIKLNKRDEISVDIHTSIVEGMEIIITRWNPEVTLTLNKENMTMTTKAYTVGELIKEQGIVLGEKYKIEPEESASIEKGMTIVVETEKINIETRQASLPYETKIQGTSNLQPGERKVQTPGKEGHVERDFEVVRFGGEIIQETQIRSNVLVEPQTEVILEGIKNVIKDVNTGKTYEYTRAMNMEATAYTDIPGDRWYGITASGMPTFIGMVAVDPKVIPLGTKLYVEGYGIAHAGDTGGAVKGNIIDLFMSSRAQARAFGRRARKVYILKDQGLNVRAARK